MFSILCLTARAGIDIGNFKVTLAMVLIAASTIYYLFLDKVFGLIMLMILVAVYPLASQIAAFRTLVGCKYWFLCGGMGFSVCRALF